MASEIRRAIDGCLQKCCRRRAPILDQRMAADAFDMPQVFRRFEIRSRILRWHALRDGAIVLGRLIEASFVTQRVRQPEHRRCVRWVQSPHVLEQRDGFCETLPLVRDDAAEEIRIRIVGRFGAQTRDELRCIAETVLAQRTLHLLRQQLSA